MTTAKERKKKKDKILFIFLAVFASLLIGGANAQITNLQCLAGILCNPSSITTVGNVTLKNASSSEVGGILALNCTGTDKVSGVGAGGNLVCGTDTGSSEATTTTLGTVKVGNCSSGFYFAGYNSTGIPNCVGELKNGTVTSITAGTGLAGGTITSTGTIDLNQATTSTLGGVILDTNCTSGYFLAQTNATGKLSCRGETANGTVTSISQGTGMSFSTTPITGTGTINLAEALIGSLGGLKITSNCSSGYFLAQTNATGQLSCVGELKNGTVTSITAGTGLSGGTITSSGTIDLNQATTSTLGGVILDANCTSGYFLAQTNATGKLSCRGETANVSSITASTGLSGGTITTTGTIALLEALTGTIGGTKILNCSSRQFVSGWGATTTPTCTSLGAGNGVSQITIGAGLGGNESPIYFNGTIFLNNASTTSMGGVLVKNCTALQSVSGWGATQDPTCNSPGAGRGIMQINYFAPLTSNSTSPLYDNVTLMVNNATTSAVGTVQVANCTSLQVMTGYTAGNAVRCGDASKNGLGISQLNIYAPLTSNESATVIYNNATLMVNNATTTVNGVVGVSNCSQSQFITGYSAGNAPSCATPLTTTNKSYEVNWVERNWGTLKPVGTAATTFTANNWAAFTANGTAVAHALANAYYIKYSNTSAVGLSANGSAGITQTTAQTQLRYLPLIRTSIMRNGSNSNMREWFGISDNADVMYFSRKGGIRAAGIFFDTNSSNTQWQCCTNDAAAGGMTCTATGIDVTANKPYNLTLNLTNYPTDIRCIVQNDTAVGTITKTSNIPTNTGSNMFVQNVAMSTTATNTVNYSIQYMYLETN